LGQHGLSGRLRSLLSDLEIHIKLKFHNCGVKSIMTCACFAPFAVN
jgi:hypothetical protein